MLTFTEAIVEVELDGVTAAINKLAKEYDESQHPRDEHGRWTSGGGLPPAPGTASIPEGHVRLYHQTGEANVAAIREHGLQLEQARGIEGPRAIYADEQGFYNKPGHEQPGQATVEFSVPRERWDPPFVRADSVLDQGRVAPESIIGIHEAWHANARYIENNPKVMASVLAGEHDDLLTDRRYGPAIRYIKEKYGSIGKAEKSTKAEADYQRVPNSGEQCADCTMYVVPSGCTAVEGYIAPHGWCKFFERKKFAKSFDRVMKDYDESKHPRDEHGRWAPGEGEDLLSRGLETKTETGYILDAAREVAKAQGFDPNKISVSTENKEFTVAGTKYKTGGEAYAATGNVIIYKGDLWTADGIKAVTAHEIMHQKYNAYKNDLAAETRAVMNDPETLSRRSPEGKPLGMRADGTLPPGLAEKYPLYTFNNAMYLNDSKGVDSWDRMKEADGVSSYSRDYWNAWESDKTKYGGQDLAINETLAEIARLDYEGSLSQRAQLGHITNIVRKPNGFLTTQPLADEWGALYRVVNSNWRKNHWYSA